MHSPTPAPVPPHPHRAFSPLRALVVIPALMVTACTSDETSSSAGSLELVPQVEYYPELLLPSAEDEAEAARHLVARLEVEDFGRVSIVDIGTDEEPEFGYFTVGGKEIAHVMEQLLEAEATPAEVFVALAEGEDLPPELALDHELKADAVAVKIVAAVHC